MGSKQWFSAACIAAGVTVVAALVVAVPSELWTNDCIAAAALLFLTFASPALVPSPRPRGGDNDAPFIWLIGPLGKLLLISLVLSALALRFGLLGFHTASWVSNVLCVGSIIFGYGILQATTKTVASAAGITAAATADARTQWTALLRMLSAQAEQEATRDMLDKLTERIRYAANDGGGDRGSLNQPITSLLGQFQGTLTNPQGLAPLVKSAEILLEQRELAIRAARSRA